MDLIFYHPKTGELRVANATSGSLRLPPAAHEISTLTGMRRRKRQQGRLDAIVKLPGAYCLFETWMLQDTFAIAASWGAITGAHTGPVASLAGIFVAAAAVLLPAKIVSRPMPVRSNKLVRQTRPAAKI